MVVLLTIKIVTSRKNKKHKTIIKPPIVMGHLLLLLLLLLIVVATICGVLSFFIFLLVFPLSVLYVSLLAILLVL